MGKTKIFKCDRCKGKIYRLMKFKTAEVTIREVLFYKDDEGMDVTRRALVNIYKLCPKCYLELMKFLENREGE